MERIKERAQYVLESSRQCPRELLKSDITSTVTSSKGKSLDQKLLEIYLEETEKQEEDSGVCNASHLLSKLVKRDDLSCLVLSLYTGNEGFSINLRSCTGVESETLKLPYEEKEVLEYIDAGELPCFLADALEKTQVSVFYSGCVIVEVRDYRRSALGSYDTYHVLLRPSAQSVMVDVQRLVCEFGQNSWTVDDAHQLESELLLKISEPLCLDPSPAVAIIKTELNLQHKRFNEPALRRAMKRYTQVAANRKRKLGQGPAPKELQLWDFLQKRREKSKTPAKILKSVDTWRQRNVNLALPQDLEIPDNIFKVGDLQQQSHDNLSLVEEHRLERDPNQDQRMLAVISVYRQHLADGYLGRLYLDHDYSGDDTNMQGCSCFFPLGVRQTVDRYLDQFRELFTEEGRRLVKMTTKRPGQPDQVTYTAVHQTPTPTPTPTPPTTPTPAMATLPPPPTPQTHPTVPGALATMAAVTTGGMSSAQALLKQATSMAAAIVSQGEGSGMSLTAKRNIPIQLSLSITPISSTTTGILTAQCGQQGGMTVAGQGSQNQTTAQRLKQLGLQHKTTPSPLTSPASTPTSTPQQIAAAILSQQAANMAQKASTSTPPPNSRTPTPTQPLAPSLPSSSSLSSRRPSSTTTTTPLEALSAPSSSQPPLPQTHNISFVTTQALPQAHNLSFVRTQEGVGGSGTNSGGTGGQGTALSNINITSLSSLPPNINLQSLGLSPVNLGLQPMQVSVSMPSIAVPVPITMINTSSSLLHTHPAILTTSSPSGSSPAALVTMVTALPASTTSSSTASSTTVTMSSQHLLMSTGSGQAGVLPTNSGMLSLPVGLTQLMPVTTKTQGTVGLRAPATLPVLQLPAGQQSIQLLSLQQQQRGGGLKAGTITAAITSTPQQGQITRTVTGNTVPLSTVLTSQQMSALTSLTVGKAGGSTTIPAGQFIQLTAGGTGGVPAQQGTSQTLHTQLAAFQKAGAAGAGGSTLQFHQLQLKQAATPTLAPAAVTMGTPATPTKGKSKKRGGPTPPKSL